MTRSICSHPREATDPFRLPWFEACACGNTHSPPPPQTSFWPTWWMSTYLCRHCQCRHMLTDGSFSSWDDVSHPVRLVLSSCCGDSIALKDSCEGRLYHVNGHDEYMGHCQCIGMPSPRCVHIAWRSHFCLSIPTILLMFEFYVSGIQKFSFVSNSYLKKLVCFKFVSPRM